MDQLTADKLINLSPPFNAFMKRCWSLESPSIYDCSTFINSKFLIADHVCLQFQVKRVCLRFHEKSLSSIPSEKSQLSSIPSEKSQLSSIPSEKSQLSSIPSEKSQLSSIPSEKSQKVQQIERLLQAHINPTHRQCTVLSPNLECINVSLHNTTDMVLILLNKRDILPWEEFTLAPGFKVKSKSSPSHHLYQLSQNTHSIDRLKFPHTDECVDYSSTYCIDSVGCFTECVNNRTVKTFNKVAPLRTLSEDEVDHFKLQLMSLTDFRNDSISAAYDEMYDECLESFRFPDCHSQTTFTSVSRHVSNNFQINVNHATEPSYSITSHPKVLLIDLITYIFGALGTWFGFSFITFNPWKRAQKGKVRSEENEEKKGENEEKKGENEETKGENEETKEGKVARNPRQMTECYQIRCENDIKSNQM